MSSSWRNTQQPEVLRILREAGHEPYDFRNQPTAFHWSEIDPDWKNWTPAQNRYALEHPVAQKGFKSDMDALRGCDVCLMLLPCGRSSHLELGYAVGAGKHTILLQSQQEEPDLMTLMVGHRCISMEEVLGVLAHISLTVPEFLMGHGC